MDILLPNPLSEVDDDQHQQRGVPDLERIRNAKKRRYLQLKRWTQYDKAKEKEEQTRYKKGFPLSRKGPKSVRFSQNLILLEAGNHGDTEEVRRLLSEGVCADVANSDGLSALHQCAINKNIDMCRILINYSANVNAKDKELWTPLHAAAICGHTEICLLLIRSGADLLALNTDGNMPYDICEDEVTLDAIENEMAARGITQEMINDARTIPERTMLRDLQAVVARHGPTTACQIFSNLDKQGANCLHVAAACGFADVTRYLVSINMPLDQVDRDGWQAIHVAALSNQLEIIEILVSKGANIDAQNKQGETIYELVYDKEMYDKLMMMKREMEKMHDNKAIISSGGLIRRRSSTNPRSASIRRTSMKEKSDLSWLEARQEAELRRTAEGGLVDGGKVSGGGGNNHVEETVHSSVRGKHKPVPETITEVEYDQGECDLDAVVLESCAEESVRPWPLPGLANKDLRGSFTHPHPYNSPTRDPDTFPYTPKTPAPPHQTKNGLGKPVVSNDTKVRHPPMSGVPGEKSQPRNPVPAMPVTSHRHSSQENLDSQPASLRSNQSRQPPVTMTAKSPPQRSSVASIKSAHTTPIGSVRSSSSQLSLHRTPPTSHTNISGGTFQREESRKQIVPRHNQYKPHKPDSCCLLM